MKKQSEKNPLATVAHGKGRKEKRFNIFKTHFQILKKRGHGLCTHAKWVMSDLREVREIKILKGKIEKQVSFLPYRSENKALFNS